MWEAVMEDATLGAKVKKLENLKSRLALGKRKDMAKEQIKNFKAGLLKQIQ
jgi:hypothetical protein